MSQFEIRVLKQGTATPKVYSVSFFTMKDAYRKFERYEQCLKAFCKKSDSDGFCTRIYTDDSGSEIALRVAESYPHVSVYHFNCQPFREEVGHIGTFGTLARFLPLFESGLEVVWVSDIDIPYVIFDTKHLSDMDRAKAQVSYRTYICYEKVYSRNYTISANAIISRIMFPRQILTKFLNKIIEGRMDNTIKQLNEYNTLNTPDKPESKIPYGIDEVFTNTTLYDTLIRYNIKCLVIKDYTTVSWWLHKKGLLKANEQKVFECYYTCNSSKLVPTMKKILLKYLPKYSNEKECFGEMLKVLPRLKNEFFIYHILQGQQLD